MMNELKAYVQNAIALAKIDAIEKLGNSMGRLVYILLAAFFILIGIAFLSIATAIYLSNLWSSYFLGFMSIAGLYFLLLLLCVVCKKSIEKWVLNQTIKKFYK